MRVACLLCWLIGHRWLEVSRRHTMCLDDVCYRCERCSDEECGVAGLVHLPRRPRLVQR